MGHDPFRVGQVGPVDSCGQVRDLDPSLKKITQPLMGDGLAGQTRRLMWTGQKY